MAVIEIDAPLTELLHKLEISTPLIQAVEEAHLTCEYLVDGVKVKTTEKTPLKSSEIASYEQVAPLKLGSLQMVLAGTLPGGAAKNLAKIAMEKTVKMVLAHTGVSISKPSFLKQVGSQEESIMPPAVDWAEAVTSAIELVKPDEEPVDEEEEAQEIPSDTVKLSVADHLYQPVKGSDPDSKYFCIALSEGLKVGVRLKGSQPTKISFRVEGSSLKNNPVKSKLLEAGLTGSESHFSVHMVAASKDLTLKSVGALLYGIGCKFDAVGTDLEKIWNKGV